MFWAKLMYCWLGNTHIILLFALLLCLSDILRKFSTPCTVVEHDVCRFSGTIELLLWKLTHEKARSHSTNKKTVWLCEFWNITMYKGQHKELLNSVKCVFICTNVCIDYSAVVFKLMSVGLDSHFSYLAVLYNRINL